MADRLAALRAQLRNYPTLDPGAVEAVSGMEGLGGGIGDQGTSFGPFQLHRGGALPASVPLERAHSWAWSPSGIDYALEAINKVAGGKKGRAAIDAIVRGFERPANPDKEIAGALRAYGLTPGSGPVPTDTGGVQANVQTQIDPGTQMALQSLAANSSSPLMGLALSVAGQRAAAPPPPTGGGPPGGGPPLKFTPGVPVADLTSTGGEHETMGLAGFPAKDYFAPSGSPVVAPVTGTVVKLSGHDPKQGPTQGPHGPLGYSVYIKGNDGRTYYMTHLGSRGVQVGETLKAGTRIGTVADYDKYGTPSHVHMGVS